MPHTPRVRFSRQPMFLIALCFAGGIVAASLSGPLPILPAIVVTGVLAALSLAFRRHGIATVLVAAAFVLAGAISFATEAARNDAPNRLRVLYDSGEIASGTPVDVEGVVAAAPERSLEGSFVTLRAETVRAGGRVRQVAGNVRIFVQGTTSDISDLKYGSRIRVSCALTREDQYQNPGVRPARASLDRQGVDAIAAVRSPLLIEHIADESVAEPLAWVYNARSRLINEFRANLSPRTAGVRIASLLGDRNFLDKDTADLFREGGTFHILVISGLHITFIGIGGTSGFLFRN